MNKNNSQRIYFRNLDILRFIAAYAIVLLHCYFGWKAFFGVPAFINSSISGTLKDKAEVAVHNLSFGVDIFFIISGFLITFLLLSEQRKTGGIDVIKFYIRRAFRIWPLYFLMVLTAPLLTYFFFEQSPDYLYQFLFAGNFDVINHGTKSVATDHLWSICIEEHFYLFCPLLIALIPVKKLPQSLLAVIVGCILFRAWVSTKPEDYGMIIYMHTLSRVDVLALGSLLGYLHFHNRLKFDHSLGVRISLYAIFVILFLGADYAECGTFFAATAKKYIFVLLAAYWAGNFLFHSKAIFTPVELNWLHGFGKASYGIYMFNPVIIFLALKLFAAYNWRNFFAFFGLVHLALFATVYLSYRFFELPFLALKEKYAVIKSGEALPTDDATETDKEEDGTANGEVIPLRTAANR